MAEACHNKQYATCITISGGNSSLLNILICNCLSRLQVLIPKKWCRNAPFSDSPIADTQDVRLNFK